jgi:hypothetical protein
MNRAGARHVFAVDKANIIHKAKHFAQENQIIDKITFIPSKVEDVSHNNKSYEQNSEKM